MSASLCCQMLPTRWVAFSTSGRLLKSVDKEKCVWNICFMIERIGPHYLRDPDTEPSVAEVLSKVPHGSRHDVA